MLAPRCNAGVLTDPEYTRRVTPMQTLYYITVVAASIYLFTLFVVVPIGILWEKISFARYVGRAWYLGGYRG